MHATHAVSQRSIASTPGHRAGLAFAIARTLVMSVRLASALAAHAQQKASTEDAQRLLHECATHSQHGEMQAALAGCDEALPMFRALGDRGSEAMTLTYIGRVYDDWGEN